MPLAQAKCTNCGANLTVDNTKDAAICPFCGTPYVVEKAINNYNVTNNIRADVVNVYGGISADFVIRAGTLEKYTGASTDVIIPNSVTRIGGYTSPKGLLGVRFSGAFSACTGLTSVFIPSSVTDIGAWAFSGCTGLTKVVIPNSVSHIGNNAFSGCTSLASITIPNSVEDIGAYAFFGCQSLASITIPASVQTIDKQAFNNCTALTELTIEGNPKLANIFDGQGSDPNYVFAGCKNIREVHASEAWRRKNRLHFPSSVNIYNGCYIATAVYGSYDCPQVWTLRRFRDNVLAESRYGRAFIRCYYAISPHLVRWFGKTRWFRTFWKRRLDRMVRRLNEAGTEDTPYQDRHW